MPSVVSGANLNSSSDTRNTYWARLSYGSMEALKE